MKKDKPRALWVSQPEKPKAMVADKARILAEAKEMITKLPKLSKKVSRVEMRANRIYMYELEEKTLTEGAVFTKPLIDGKYLEYPYARITLGSSGGESCTADCQRYNDKWMELYAGTLAQCMDYIENDDGWF